jgi:hypothetical protein
VKRIYMSPPDTCGRDFEFVREALGIQLPNQLRKEPGRQEPVDVVRHEDDPKSPFKPVGR